MIIIIIIIIINNMIIVVVIIVITIYIYIYIYINDNTTTYNNNYDWFLSFQGFQRYGLSIFESDTPFLRRCVCIVFSRLATLRIEGCLSSTLSARILYDMTRKRPLMLHDI